MGLGDELMAAGEAWAFHQRTSLPVAICDKRGEARKHPLWDVFPFILQKPREAQENRITNGPGCRPYITNVTKERFTWRKYCPLVAPLLSEKRQRQPFVVLEPNTKGGPGSNKDWGWDKWLALNKALASYGIETVQLGAVRSPRLPGTTHVTTPVFRDAMSVISQASGVVTTEGAMHHAAACLGIPAVIIYGGFISPQVTGYEGQINFAAEGLGCGSRKTCVHCRTAMDAITVDQIFNATVRIYR